MSVTVSEQLPLLAAAPNGIRKLRELILELAVRGKLVAQDAGDEPAGELLKRIAAERKRLVAAGKIKQQKLLAKIGEEETPHDLPPSWEWVRLPDIYYPVSVSGNKLLSSQISETGSFPVIDQGKRFVAGYTDDSSLLISLPGPVVVFGDHTTERKYIDFDFVAGADGVKILRPLLQDERFFWWQLVGLRLEGRGYARHFKVLNDALYALPPKMEQSRIVAKVAELMALCDRLEAQQSDAESAHAQLVATLLGSLTQASDADDFTVSWQRLSAHFHTLFTTESSIDALKPTLLQLAVMGKLTQQDSREEPAGELLKRVAAEKKRLVAEGRIKQPKMLAEIGVAAQPFTLPEGWLFVRLGEFGLIGSSARVHQKDWKSSGVPFYRAREIIRLSKYGSVENELFISEELYESLSERGLMPAVGDLMITGVGTIGVPYHVCLGDRFYYKDASVLVFKNYVEDVSNYLLKFMSSPMWVKAIHTESMGTTVHTLTIARAADIVLPVPPLAEQHRIVVKLDQLMALCDKLSAAIKRRNQHSRHLADALVDKALSPVSRTSTNVVDLSCYLVDRLVAKPTFGRTTHMKLIYLADTHLGFDFQGEYMREAAGPLDKNIYQVEKHAEANGWYTHTLTPLKSGKEKVTYHATDALATKARQVAEALGGKRHGLDQLIALLGDKKTEEVEIVATLFAAWNDSLLDGQSPSDDWVIREVRENWHVEKQRFTAENLGHWLDWMRKHHLVPTGKPPRTQQQIKMFH